MFVRLSIHAHFHYRFQHLIFQIKVHHIPSLGCDKCIPKESYMPENIHLHNLHNLAIEISFENSRSPYY